MTSGQQYSLALIPHKLQNVVIQQRARDGYIDATAMCKVAAKQFNDYSRNGTTREFLAELATETGIPVSELIQSLKGGDGPQGTWVHPDVAINLAQWLSPKFAVQVSKWVREWMSGGQFAGGTMPYHLQRYTKNAPKIPYTHFSVLSEMVLHLIAPLEREGYTIPENLVPDISQGKFFAKWLRDTKGIDTDAMPTYDHEYEDGRVFPAKLYPIAWLIDFRHHFNTVWLPQKAKEYFKTRDPAALPHLDKVIAALEAPKESKAIAPPRRRKPPLPAPKRR